MSKSAHKKITTQSNWVRPVRVGTDSEQAEENVTERYVQLEPKSRCYFVIRKADQVNVYLCTHHMLI